MRACVLVSQGLQQLNKASRGRGNARMDDVGCVRLMFGGPDRSHGLPMQCTPFMRLFQAPWLEALLLSCAQSYKTMEQEQAELCRIYIYGDPTCCVY